MSATAPAAPPSVLVPQPTTGPSAGLALNDPSTQIMLTSWVGALAKAVADWQGMGHLDPATLGLIGGAVALTISVLVAKHVISASLVRSITTDAGTVLTAVTQNLPPATPQTVQEALAAVKAAVDALASMLPVQGAKT